MCHRSKVSRKKFKPADNCGACGGRVDELGRPEDSCMASPPSCYFCGSHICDKSC